MIKEIQAYQASDGKLFSDKKSCFEYEEELKKTNLIIDAFDKTYFLDEDKKSLKVNYDDSSIPYDITYIVFSKKVNKEQITAVKEYLGREYDVHFSSIDDTVYVYSDETYSYHSLSEKIEELEYELDECKKLYEL